MFFVLGKVCEGKTVRTGTILGICTVGRNPSGHQQQRGVEAGTVPAFRGGER